MRDMTIMTDQHIHICGAGILGLMQSYYLVEAGHRITLYDGAGVPAKNASMIAGGMLAPYSEIEHMDDRWVQASLESVRAWRDIPLELGFINAGSLFVAHPEDQYILERFKTHLPDDLRANVDVGAYEDDLTERFSHGVFLEEEAHVHPAKCIGSLVEYLTASDRFSFVPIHQNPESIQGDFVLDCRGIYAGEPDLRGVKGEILLVKNEEFSLARPVRLMHPRYPLYIVPRPEGVFMIGATVIESHDESGADLHVSMRSAMELMSALYSMHSSFAEAHVLEYYAGVRPSYPDNLPRITPRGNMLSVNGSFRHGYLLAPLMAECVKAYVAGKTHPRWDLFCKGAKAAA